METSTELTEKQRTIQTLCEHGFRVMHSGDTCILMKPKHASTLHVAQVTADGTVNTLTLSEFLDNILS
jgi:hypothetical protein